MTASAVQTEALWDKDKLWTYDEAREAFPDLLLEIFDGVLYARGSSRPFQPGVDDPDDPGIMSSPSICHQMILLRLAILWEAWTRAANAGKVYLSPTDMQVASGRRMIPDLMFVRRERFESGERIEREDGSCVVAPPDLTVEIISPSSARTDRVTKLNAYVAFGIARYWLLSPDERTLQAFALENGRYFLESALAETDTLQLAAFSGLQISLSDVFASAS